MAELGGADAATFEFSAPTVNLRERVVVTVHDGEAFEVHYTTTSDLYEADMQDFESILALWSWSG